MDDIVKNSLEVSQGFIDLLVAGFAQIFFYTLIVLVVVSFVLFISYKARKRIIFNPWVNRFDPNDTELGKSIADLLLFKLNYIKRTHVLSSTKESLWNTFQDIPSFRQNLDKEIDLLASLQLGNYGKIVSGISSILFKIIPIFIKPASLSGSIDSYGDKKAILHISLDNYSPKKWFKYESLYWEIEKEALTKENIPELIEEIAYRIYIDLSGGDLFKSWECFMYFTQGLRSYLNYIELNRQTDLRDAESLYQKALEYELNNSVVKYNIGVLKYYQFQDKSNDEAIDCFRHAINCNDLNLRARALCGMANAYGQKQTRFKTGKSDPFETLRDAMEFANKALLLNNRLDSAYRALAYTNHQYGEALAALADSDQCVIKNPDSETNQYRKRAIQYYNKTLKLNKQHYIAHNNLANLYLQWAIQIRDKAVSVSLFQNWKLKIRMLFPRNFIIDKNYFLQMATYHCEEALRINPSYFFAFDNLGNIYYEKNDFKKAYTAYQNAVLYAPGYAEAMNDLAMLFLVKKYENYNYEKALEKHKEAILILKDEPKRKEKLIKAFKDRMVLQEIPENRYA